MTAKTVKDIRDILSGAFAAAVRWGWLERNPADTAKLPKAPAAKGRPPAPSPAEAARVITAACALLATSLFGDVAAALREHGSATLDEHCCYFRRPD
jgi:hypothetical protein